MSIDKKTQEIDAWLSQLSTNNSSTSTWQSDRSKPSAIDDAESQGNVPPQNILDAISETSAEYAAYTKEMTALFNKLGIDPRTFSAHVKENLQKLTWIQKSLDLVDFHSSTLATRLQQKKLEDLKKSREEQKLKSKYNEILQRNAMLEKKVNLLQHAIDSAAVEIDVEQTELSNRSLDDKLLLAKLREYEQMVDCKQRDIDDLDVGELLPDKLLEKHKMVLELQEQLSKLNEALEPYGDLPPNLLQAKSIVEQKELEYSQLSRQLSSINL